MTSTTPLPDWWLVTRTISGQLATSVAFDAILAAEQRLQNLGQADLRFAFQALAEGTWWVAALDEQLFRQLKAVDRGLFAAYQTDRNIDPDGQYIQAFLWVRNRHSHQLPFTTGYNGPRTGGSVPSRYSRELIWLPSDNFPPAAKGHDDQKGQATYDRLLAGEPINETLYHCLLWFQKVAGRDPEWEQQQRARRRSSGRSTSSS